MKYECPGCGEELSETELIKLTDELGRCPNCDEEFDLNSEEIFEVDEEYEGQEYQDEESDSEDEEETDIDGEG